MRESARERSARYIESTESAVKRVRIRKPFATISDQRLDYVLELVRGYVKDARHYNQEQKPVTSLACISYAEGLLDAIKFLELADF